MKLYSQMDKRLPQPNQPNNYMNSLPLQQMVRDQGSSYQNNQNNNKRFSFRLQPQQHFLKSKSNKAELFNVPSHITLNEQEQSPKEQRSRSKRKKIFDRKVTVFKLNSQDQPKIIIKDNAQNVIQQFIPQKQAKLSTHQPIQSQKQQSFQQEQSSWNQELTSKSVNLSNQNRFKGNRYINFNNYYDREKTNKLLSEPILKISQETIDQPYSGQPQKIEEVLRYVPVILKRLTDNQKKIIQLNEKLQQIRLQKQSKLYNSSSPDLKPTPQHDLQYFNLYNPVNAKTIYKSPYHPAFTPNQSNQTLKMREKDRLRLQQQQYRRLQLLIKENQYLSRRVLAAQSKRKTAQQINIQNRIQALKHHRLQIQQQPINQANQSFNNDSINISIIPHQGRERPAVHQSQYPRYLGGNRYFQTFPQFQKGLMKINVPIKAASVYSSAKVDRFIPTSKIF